MLLFQKNTVVDIVVQAMRLTDVVIVVAVVHAVETAQAYAS
jgi:multisubunit Na+/H+ antiporter MnhC subunit